MALPESFQTDFLARLHTVESLTEAQKTKIVESLSAGKEIQWNLLFSQNKESTD